jgi:hypothetical protein
MSNAQEVGQKEQNPADVTSLARRRLSLNPPNLFPITFTRIFDHEFEALSPWLQPISSGAMRALRSSVYSERYRLSKVFVAARDLFGPSSPEFDPYKMSFRYPLFLSAIRDGLALHYVVTLSDRRGGLNVSFLRLGEERGEGLYAADRAPIDREFSGPELDYLAESLLGYLLGHAKRTAPTQPDFYRVIQSESIVYGRRAGEWFEKQADDSDAFRRIRETIAADLAESESQQERAYKDSLVEDITRGCPRAR